MKTRAPAFTLCLAALFLTKVSSHAQEKAQRAIPVESESYEALPTFQPADILQPAYVQGEHFTLRPSAPTYGGGNHYVIDSDYGVFEADGNQILMRRIAEINAIARLREMSQSAEFKEALGKAAEAPLDAAKSLVDNPRETLKAVPRGIVGFLKRTGESVKEVASGRERGENEGNAIENISGYTKTKRGLALSLGVDPYSSNLVLQDELAEIARPAFAGKFLAGAGLAAIPGGAGAAVTALNTGSKLADALRDKSPTELRSMNFDIMVKRMGIPERTASAFLNNNSISPTAQTVIVDALAQLGNISGQTDFIRLVAKSRNEGDAFACQQSAQLMALVQPTAPIVRITQLRGLPVCQTQDGIVIIPIQWDYVAWTPLAEKFVTALKAEKMPVTPTGYSLVLTGDVSPKATKELTARGVTVNSRALPGPLK